MQAPTTTGSHAGAVPVRFEPPDDLGPGESGLLLDGNAESRDATAVLMDLVCRGYLILEPSGEDFALRKGSGPTDALSRHEHKIRDAAYRDLNQVDRIQLSKSTHLGPALDQVRSDLDRVGRERQWILPAPRVPSYAPAIAVALFVGLPFLVLNLINMGSVDRYLPFGVPVPTWAILAAGVIITVGLLLILPRFRRRRTPLGQALAEQAEGFRTYLATAEADQIRFEEAEQIFSRYLPYAIAFGVADRWADTFGEVQDRARCSGFIVAQPRWASDGSDGGTVGARVGNFSRRANRLASRSRNRSGSAGGRGGGGRSRRGSGGRSRRRTSRGRRSGGGRSGSRSRSW